MFAMVCALPLSVHASFLDDFVGWLVPQELKTVPAPIEEEKRSGGILIVADPAVISGDTPRGYFLPALGKRSFIIRNEGAVDLFLNRSRSLTYTASPTLVPGDVPGAFALNVGFERTITISNPTTSTNFYLSKTNLGILSSSTSTLPTVFVSDARSQARIVEGVPTKSIASFTFLFSLNNATNKDIYINKLINPSNFLKLVPVSGAVSTIKFIESEVQNISGDSANAFVVPAGTDRPFEVTGILDNTKGTAGSKGLEVASIEYSHSPSLTSPLRITGVSDLRGLRVAIVGLGAGELSTLPVKSAASASTSPSRSATPSPIVTSAASPSPSVSPKTTVQPKVSASVSPKAKPSSTPPSTPWVPATVSPSVSATASPRATASPTQTPLTTSPSIPVMTPPSNPLLTPLSSPSSTPSPVMPSAPVFVPPVMMPSLSGSPVSSGSSTSRGVIATVLFAAGELLDSFFSR